MSRVALTVYYLGWITPPVIMCGSWKYGPIGGWLLLVYWVVGVINFHYHATAEIQPARVQSVIGAAVCAQALGMSWSWYGFDAEGHAVGDFAIFGPTAAGVGLAAGGLIAAVGTALVYIAAAIRNAL